jgi:circadian clock protein KaiB
MRKPAEPQFKFRLYVAGDGPNSAKAIANLKALCAEHLVEKCEIEIVDVLVEQQRAIADGVLLTPLLMKTAPAPVLKVVGTLSNLQPLLLALGLPQPIHERQ